MTAASQMGLGIVLAASMLTVMLIDTAPQKYRTGILVAACIVFVVALLATAL